MAHPLSVLAVYRDRDLRERIAALLTASKLVALLAESGQEGLVLARKHKPAIVLLDWFLPDITGTEFEMQVRADHQLAGVAVVFTNNWERSAMVGQILTSTLPSRLAEPEMDRLLGFIDALTRR